MAESARALAHSCVGGYPASAEALRPAPFRGHLAAQLRRSPTEVAVWAGHSVEVLMRIYSRCMTGLEDVWVTRMNQALHLGEEPTPGKSGPEDLS